MCLQTTAEEEDKWGSVVRTDHQFFQEFVDDNENTKSLAEATPSGKRRTLPDAIDHSA